MKWFLFRHGAPELSARGLCYGKLDVGLSEVGRNSMARLSVELDGLSLTALYSSPRRRALESASILGRRLGLEPVVDARFAEIDFGDFEGMSYDEVKAAHPDLYEVWMTRPTVVKFPGGESFQEMRSRVLEAAAAVYARHRGEGVALVSHGGVNRILLAEALGVPHENVFRIAQAYGALSVIDYLETTPVVELVNRPPAC